MTFFPSLMKMGAEREGREEAARRELARLKGERSGLGRRILAVDPGTAATGICLLVDGRPEWIQTVLVKGRTAEDRLPEMCSHVSEVVAYWATGSDTVAIEWQAIRPGDPRPDDIKNLFGVVGAALAAIPTPHPKVSLLTPLPVQWKGSIEADIFTKRILALFPAAGDMMSDCPAHLQHNGIDALGLAVWAIRKALPWQA